MSGMFETPFAECPDRDQHRVPEGPCEDVAQCYRCGSITFALRPVGETYGFHDEDCSLPIQHERACVGGGTGHPPGKIRGFWGPSTKDDIRRERDRWSALAVGDGTDEETPA